MENISDKKKLESQLTQSQKMEAIGTLAGGIAHDFNNILSAIMGYTELAVLGVPENPPAKQNLREELKASHRANDLVRQILTFSRQGEQERKPVLISPIVSDTGIGIAPDLLERIFDPYFTTKKGQPGNSCPRFLPVDF